MFGHRSRYPPLNAVVAEVFNKDRQPCLVAVSSPNQTPVGTSWCSPFDRRHVPQESAVRRSPSFCTTRPHPHSVHHAGARAFSTCSAMHASPVCLNSREKRAQSPKRQTEQTADTSASHDEHKNSWPSAGATPASSSPAAARTHKRSFQHRRGSSAAASTQRGDASAPLPSAARGKSARANSQTATDADMVRTAFSDSAHAQGHAQRTRAHTSPSTSTRDHRAHRQRDRPAYAAPSTPQNRHPQPTHRHGERQRPRKSVETNKGATQHASSSQHQVETHARPTPQSSSSVHPRESNRNRRHSSQATHKTHNGAATTSPQASSLFPSPASLGAAGVPKERVFEHLLRTHSTAYQNYTALNKDPRVVHAFGRVCLEAVKEALHQLLPHQTRSQGSSRSNTACGGTDSQLRVFFDASFSSYSASGTAASQDEKATSYSGFGIPWTKGLGGKDGDAPFVAPFSVPPLDSSAFAELLGMAATPQDGDEALEAHVQHVVHAQFVSPLTRSAPHDTEATPASYAWPWQEKLDTLWLVPSAVCTAEEATKQSQSVVNDALASPAAREKWRQARLHELVELANTVAFFKWLKDEQIVMRDCGTAKVSETTHALSEECEEAELPARDVAKAHLLGIQKAHEALREADAQQRRSPSSDGTTMTMTGAQRVSAAAQRLAATQQALSHAQALRNLIPKVDDVILNEQNSCISNKAEVEKEATLIVSRDARSFSASIHVFDMLLMLLLRVLIPLWATPAVSSADRAALFRLCALPWFTTERDTVCLPLAKWLVYLELATVLSTAQRGQGQLQQRAPPLEGELQCVQLLRLLCWPTPLDVQSTIVERALSKMQNALAASATSSPPLASSSSSISQTAPLKELLAVLNSTETRQRVAYDLLYLLFYAQDESHGACQRAATSALTSLNGNTTSIPAHLLRSQSVYVRTVSALCVYVMDVDRFMTDRFAGLPEPCTTVLPTMPNSHAHESVTGWTARGHEARARLLMDVKTQAHTAGALTRHLFLSLSGADLSALWTAMTRKRGVWLWRAYMRVVGRLCVEAICVAVEAAVRVSGENHTATDAVLAADGFAWTCLAPLRAQLLQSPDLQQKVTQFLLDSLSEAATRATSARTGKPAVAKQHKPDSDRTDGQSATTPPETSLTEENAAVLSASHVLQLGCIAALLLEVAYASVGGDLASHHPVTPMSLEAFRSRQPQSTLWRDVSATFEQCLRAYLQQPQTALGDVVPPTTRELGTPSCSPGLVEREAEATLVRLVQGLGSVHASRPPTEVAEEDTRTCAGMARVVPTRMATLLSEHVLTPKLRTDVAVTLRRRDEAARCRKRERPHHLSHAVLRHWYEGLWQSEVSGLSTSFPLHAARVHQALVTLLLTPSAPKTTLGEGGKETAPVVDREPPVVPATASDRRLPSLSLDEVGVILSVLVHLHTRAGLQFVRAAAARPSLPHQRYRHATPQSVFDLLAHAAAANEAAARVPARASGQRGGDGGAAERPVEQAREMQCVLVELLSRAVKSDTPADATTAENDSTATASVRRVPLSIWLDAVLLGLVSIVDVQAGTWPTASLQSGVTAAMPPLFHDPRDSWHATEPTTPPQTAGNTNDHASDDDGDRHAPKEPSMEAWLQTFREHFHSRRATRLTSGLILRHFTAFLDPLNGGWHSMSSAGTSPTRVGHSASCLQLFAPTSKATRTSRDSRHDAAMDSTRQLLVFLQRELLQSELSEAVTTATTRENDAHTQSSSLPRPPLSPQGSLSVSADASVPRVFAFSEEEGLKEVARCVARVYTLTSALQIPPKPLTQVEERAVVVLLLRALFDLWHVAPRAAAASSDVQNMQRIATEALLSLAAAAQLLSQARIVDNDTATAASTHAPCSSRQKDDNSDEPSSVFGACETASQTRAPLGTPPRLPPTSPCRAWEASVLEEAATASSASPSGRMNSACADEHTTPDAVDVALLQSLNEVFALPAAPSSSSAREEACAWLAGVAQMDAALLQRAVRVQAAHWLRRVRELFTSAHAASANAVLSARTVVFAVVATHTLTSLHLVPASVSDEVMSTCGQLLHRLAEDRRVASQSGNLFLTAALVAPRMSVALLPIAQHLRDTRDQLSLVEVVRALQAMTVAAQFFDAQHDAQAERQSHEVADAPLLLLSTSASTHSVPATPSIEFQAHEAPHEMNSAARGVRHSLASLPSGRGQPPALRSAWLALARRLLSREVVWLSDHGSTHSHDDAVAHARRALLAEAWSHALACGAAMGCADSTAFAQLLATLLYGSGEAGTSSSSEATTCVVALPLSLEDWSRVIVACGSVVDIERDELAALLREPVLNVLRTYAQPEEGVHSECTAWRDVCVFVEALPTLFVESTVFWKHVREMVKRVIASSSQPGSRQADRVAFECYQSYNWAALTAGHPSLRVDVPH